MSFDHSSREKLINSDSPVSGKNQRKWGMSVNMVTKINYFQLQLRADIWKKTDPPLPPPDNLIRAKQTEDTYGHSIATWHLSCAVTSSELGAVNLSCVCPEICHSNTPQIPQSSSLLFLSFISSYWLLKADGEVNGH